MTHTLISPEVIEAYIRRRAVPGSHRNFGWGFGLTSYSKHSMSSATVLNDDGSFSLDDAPNTDIPLGQVGVVTLGGERLPLTRSLVSSLETPCWLKGAVQARLCVPDLLTALQPKEPLPFVGLHVEFIQPRNPHPSQCPPGKHAVSLRSQLSPSDCETQLIVILSTERPSRWPR